MDTKEKQLRLLLSASTGNGDNIIEVKRILAEMIKMENPRTSKIEDYRLIKKLKSQLVLWEGRASCSAPHELLKDAGARSMLEEVLLSLVMQENLEVVWRKSDLVYLLVWAVENEMQELAEQLILTESVSCMQEVRYGGGFECAWDVVLKLRSRISKGGAAGADNMIYEVLLKRMLSRLEVQAVLLERKQTLLNFANAILLVGALISGAAYQGWLQPPLGYSFEDQRIGYANVDQSKFVRCFILSNTISFFLAVGSMIAGATTAIPAREHVNILDLLKCVQCIVVLASVMLSISIAFLMKSFWFAGFAIVDAPSAMLSNNGRSAMHGFMVAGNVVCVSMFAIALVRLLPLLFAQHPQFLKLCPVP